jgi:hypothetical protein
MMEAMTLLPSSSLVVICLLIKASFFKESQRPLTVTVRPCAGRSQEVPAATRRQSPSGRCPTG